MTGWKESANTVRDFRHTHDAPEVAKPKGAGKRKPWKVYCSRGGGSGIFLRDGLFGKYATEKDAEQAVMSKKDDPFYYNFSIQGPRK